MCYRHEWREVHVLHDVDVARRDARWSARAHEGVRSAARQHGRTNDEVLSGQFLPPLEVVASLSNLTAEASAAVERTCAEAGIVDRG